MIYVQEMLFLQPQIPSPDCSEKPGVKNAKVSCFKKATNGSSF